MGREAKILLAFLGLLAGVFVGVLSMKLLVPRPPTGAGPDIHAPGELATASYVEPTAIVDPPALTLPVAAFAAAPPLMTAPVIAVARLDEQPQSGNPLLPRTEPLDAAADAADLVAETPAPADDLLPPPAEFVLAPPARPIEEGEPPRVAEPPQDPFVARTSWQPPVADPVVATSHVTEAELQNPRPTFPGSHVAQPGDSWWSVAEAAYGDGRLYRALFAWNRALEPRVSLAAGTRLEVPPLAKLQAAWPKLVPADGPTDVDPGITPDSR